MNIKVDYSELMNEGSHMATSKKQNKDEMNRKGANKDKRERPKGLIIQEIDADITNPAFVMRTAEAEGHFLYSKLNEESNSVAVQTQNRTYENLSFRANVIAYLKAMVLYVAHGGWEESFNDFIRWSKEYDLYCKMAFFGDLIEESERATQKTNRRGPTNLLTFLPSEFSKDELAKLLIDRGKRSSATQILNMWEARGYVERLNEPRGLYKKIC